LQGRFQVEVVTTSGRAAGVEFWRRLEVVEIWHHRRKVGVLDRERLSGWLAEPESDVPLEVNMVALTFDRAVDRRGRVAITLPDVEAWTLSPAALAGLQSLVSSS
jgi:hypothetical protein